MLFHRICQGLVRSVRGRKIWLDSWPYIHLSKRNPTHITMSEKNKNQWDNGKFKAGDNSNS